MATDRSNPAEATPYAIVGEDRRPQQDWNRARHGDSEHC